MVAPFVSTSVHDMWVECNRVLDVKLTSVYGWDMSKEIEKLEQAEMAAGRAYLESGRSSGGAEAFEAYQVAIDATNAGKSLLPTREELEEHSLEDYRKTGKEDHVRDAHMWGAYWLRWMERRFVTTGFAMSASPLARELRAFADELESRG